MVVLARQRMRLPGCATAPRTNVNSSSQSFVVVYGTKADTWAWRGSFHDDFQRRSGRSQAQRVSLAVSDPAPRDVLDLGRPRSPFRLLTEPPGR